MTGTITVPYLNAKASEDPNICWFFIVGLKSLDRTAFLAR